MRNTTFALSLGERLTIRHFRASVPRENRWDFHEILSQLLEAELEFTQHPRTREHVIVGSSVVAVYRTLLMSGLAPHAAKERTGAALSTLWRRVTLMTMRLFYSISRDAFEAVRRYTTERIQAVYGPSFQIENEEWEDGFVSIVTTCGFKTFLVRHNALFLLDLFCEWDRLWIDALPRGIGFDRSQTIARGASCCRFEFTRTKGPEARKT